MKRRLMTGSIAMIAFTATACGPTSEELEARGLREEARGRGFHVTDIAFDHNDPIVSFGTGGVWRCLGKMIAGT